MHGLSRGIPWEAVLPFSLGIPEELPRISLGIPWETAFSVVLCGLLKGALPMTLVPFTDCCLLLGVDPKTLRLWLTSAHLLCTLHPTDGRLKCLTPPQLHHLAELHGRCLPDPLPGQGHPTVSSSVLTLPCSQATPLVETTCPSTQPPESEWRQQMSVLQAQVTTLQQQVTELALALLRERSSSIAPACIPASASLTSPRLPPKTAAVSPPSPLVAATPPKTNGDPTPARSRALALIEYGADGHYVLIAPTEGVLSFVPDSPEWFAWLSSLVSFTFEGQHGRFTATRKFRKGQRIQSWNIHRSLHGRSCTVYLGLTPTLTIARLEEMATAVQARLTDR
jgi:hypothetical protein